MTTPAHTQESRALQKLLDAAEAAAAVLAKGKWAKDSTDPEAVALYKLIDAIALAKASLEID